MIVRIIPSVIGGTITAPPSKSSGQRACAAALLTPGNTVIKNIGNSNDEKAAINIIKKLGAEVNARGNELAITSHDFIFKSAYPTKNLLLDTGESGLGLRMFAPIAALFNYNITFIGKGSLLYRPMDFFEKYFPRLGIEVSSDQGRLPITIRGPLRPKNIRVSGALSSQFLTGLLFAFSKSATRPVTITVENLQSRPYIDLTINVLTQFGFRVKEKTPEVFEILPRKELPLHTIMYQVEGDWSNAAFLLVAAAIAGEITLKGLDLQSPQGDKKIMEALYACGADVKITKNTIEVKRGELRAFSFDATNCPDLFPPLVALAAYCKGKTTIRGVNRLLHKESNRAVALREEFKKMKVSIDINGDVMEIVGGGILKGAEISSHNDHRIAMACAIAALQAKGRTDIFGAEAVNKSYPDFFSDLKRIAQHKGEFFRLISEV